MTDPSAHIYSVGLNLLIAGTLSIVSKCVVSLISRFTPVSQNGFRHAVRSSFSAYRRNVVPNNTKRFLNRFLQSFLAIALVQQVARNNSGAPTISCYQFSQQRISACKNTVSNILTHTLLKKVRLEEHLRDSQRIEQIFGPRQLKIVAIKWVQHIHIDCPLNGIVTGKKAIYTCSFILDSRNKSIFGDRILANLVRKLLAFSAPKIRRCVN